MNKASRPSPSHSATLFNPGTIMIGNDGSSWIVNRNSSNGVQRWVRYHGTSQTTQNIGKITNLHVPQSTSKTTTLPTEIKSTSNNQSEAMTKAAKTQAKEVRKIDTSMINKHEVFRMLALAESTGLPLLLVGPPGVGKTKTVLEYAKAWLNKDKSLSQSDFASKIFILETDEGTKPSEIKGMPDLETLFKENKYELSTPIAQADIVIINEVDKASSNIRNSMLGVMNEKFLFNGKHKIPCKWKLFIATCNEIPKEESDNPFWDRFMLKMNVSRISASEMIEYYKKGGRAYKESFDVNVPTDAEMDQVNIPASKLSKYIEVAYSVSSDRTLTFVPKIAKAVSYIWDCSIDKALVKTAEIMVDSTAGSTLQSKLFSPAQKAVLGKIDMLKTMKTNDELEMALAEIETLIDGFTGSGKMDASEVADIEVMIADEIRNHPARKDLKPDEAFDVMVDEANMSSIV